MKQWYFLFVCKTDVLAIKEARKAFGAKYRVGEVAEPRCLANDVSEESSYHISSFDERVEGKDSALIALHVLCILGRARCACVCVKHSRGNIQDHPLFLEIYYMVCPPFALLLVSFYRANKPCSVRHGNVRDALSAPVKDARPKREKFVSVLAAAHPKTK